MLIQGAGRLLTIKQVAELLQVPQSWVYGRTRARDHSRLPRMRIGKYWRFRESDILAWLETQKF
jgi:excisionase family DNA binding protein